MPAFQHHGLTFNYRETGKGNPFLFQHGLGGDVNQPFGLFKPPDGFRLISLDCRAHGMTPAGDPNQLDIPTLTDDCAALLDCLSIRRAVIGGISMGAAIAINFAMRFPTRVLALVLSRPAWLDAPPPANVAVYTLIADLIREHGAKKGEELFKQSTAYHSTLSRSPDSAASLLKQFTHPRAEGTVARLYIVRDVPVYSAEEWASIRIPTLVMANKQDTIHPFEIGQAMAGRITGSQFAELTPKSVSVEAHNADVQRHIQSFLISNCRKRREESDLCG